MLLIKAIMAYEIVYIIRYINSLIFSSISSDTLTTIGGMVSQKSKLKFITPAIKP
jgi:hypothetical protein